MSHTEQMREALAGLLARYVGLVESGDAGNWDAEEEPEVIAARAALTAPAAEVPEQSTRLRGGVPEGWKLMPVEPTPEMVSDGGFAETSFSDSYRGDCLAYIGDDAAKACWKAMLQAAPQAPAAALDAGVVRDAEILRYVMDWNTKDFAVCKRVGATGQCWEPIKTTGPIEAAMSAQTGKGGAA